MPTSPCKGTLLELRAVATINNNEIICNEMCQSVGLTFVIAKEHCYAAHNEPRMCNLATRHGQKWTHIRQAKHLE